MTVSIDMFRETEDNALTGAIHSLTFDANFALVENKTKSKDSQPDYKIMAASPKGYPVEIGAVWERVAKQTEREYMGLQFNINGQIVRANAFEDEEGGTFNVIPQDNE